MSTEQVSAGDSGALVGALVGSFVARHGRQPTGVFAAPGRVNLIGEHLDYNGGCCLPLALPQCSYAAVAPRTDGILSVASRQITEDWLGTVADLAPGGVSGWAAYVAGVVWALVEEGWQVPGLDVVVDSAVPVGAGLSSSAALTCSVALAVADLAGRGDATEVRRTLVRACMRAESEMAGAPTGGMDQSVALLAQPGHALLLDFTTGDSQPVRWDPGSEGLALLVVDTRVRHRLNDGRYAARRADCASAARALGVVTLREVHGLGGVLAQVPDDRVRRRARHVLGEMDRVDAAVDALRAGQHAALGPLLDASHDSLRDDFEVSCPELDLVVDTCRQRGAVGARMTGGGFGGSAIVLVRRTDVASVSHAVAAAFAERGWAAPAFLASDAGPGARRVR